MIPEIFQVLSNKFELPDVATITVVPQNEERCPAFQPGQFFMLYVYGIGEVPISISGAADDRSCLTFTIRAVGAVSRALIELDEGEPVGLRGPFGRGWPIADLQGRDLMIIAGGIGLAPLRPALYEVLSNRSQYGEVALLYGSRSPDDCLYEDECSSWKGSEKISVLRTVDVAPTGYRGRVGVVTRLIPPALKHLQDPAVLMCGPEIMMRFALPELNKGAVKREHTFLSFERNMKCALGVCGRCQFGPSFICKDGPVLSYAEVESLLHIREC